MKALLGVLALTLAGGASAAPLSELAVRVEEGGVTTLKCDAPKLDVNSWLSGGRDYVFRGDAGGAPVDWTARRTVSFEAGERVEGYRIEGPGLEARLEPRHADRADYRLVVTSSGTEQTLRFEPESGGSAVEFVVSGGGLDLRSRTSGQRSVLSGDYAAGDAVRLAAAGAALALIRLDPPLRRRKLR